ncbi:hypothetical protein BJ322DRAFT_864126 [Thelephora terrestris]|uniref:XPG-I domain-containing protein n=1 Tax=Thelephora terrestris TaxID=56493 RepID=A0A9P6HDF8_9AGAM|nr:hypothetical protein BJ322DRAFT_864126 [Thelephora terrestris]
MGVPGLWDLLRPAGERRSLANLAIVDGFENNVKGFRGLRIGIDASIWFYHAAYGREGENPELRTLFFRCSRLLGIPLLPLFVFDGPKRPSIKRNKKISGKAHWLTDGMKNIIEAFGFEWHLAPGEAEAELAFLNRTGVIDAVLSDDVDTFVFGGKMVVRNPNGSLSGNRPHATSGSSSKDDGNHAVIFRASEFSKPEIDLTHGGLILIALLSGGDYHQAGLSGCGPKVAHGLAKCGFGDSLLSAARTLSREGLQEFLVTWKQDLAEELRTNSRGILGRKLGSLSKAIPEEFPDIDILMSYANPITSETEGKVHRIKLNWERPLDLGRIAHICELYFEWGVRHVIIKRFRTVIWPAAVFRFLRESVLEKDPQNANGPYLSATAQPSESQPPSSSPATSTAASLSHLQIGSSSICQQLILKIRLSRNHDSTDGLLEYRLEVSPERLVALATAGIKDIRPPLIADICSSDDTSDSDKRTKKPPPDPSSNLRVWVAASIVRTAMPSLVDSYEEGAKRKASKKSTRAKPMIRSEAIDEGTPTIQEDPEEPQKREPRPRPNLKTFYPVTKPEEHTSKSPDVHHRDDRLTSGGRSKILSLIDNLAATDTSQRGMVSPPTTANKGGSSITGKSTRQTVDKEKQPQLPYKVPVHPGPATRPTPAPKPPQLRGPTSGPQDTTSNDIIEISSDSDEGQLVPNRTKPMVAPLLIARSRRRGQSQAPDDIIDLT